MLLPAASSSLKPSAHPLHGFFLLHFIQVAFGTTRQASPSRYLHKYLLFHTRHRFCTSVQKRQKQLQIFLFLCVGQRSSDEFSTGALPTFESFCSLHSVGTTRGKKAPEPSTAAAVKVHSSMYQPNKGHPRHQGCFCDNWILSCFCGLP